MGKAKQKNQSTKGRKLGRAVKAHLDDVLQIRLSEEDHAQWTKYALESGMTLSQWIRFQCVRAANGNAKPVSVEFVTGYPAAAEQLGESDPSLIIEGRGIPATPS